MRGGEFHLCSHEEAGADPPVQRLKVIYTSAHNPSLLFCQNT